MKAAIKIFLVIHFLTGLIYTQDEEHKRNFKMPEGNGHISGVVVDKLNNQPLMGVNIVFFKTMKDTVKVKGVETDDKGKFNAEVPYGKYKIEVSYVGYSDAVVSNIIVFPKNPEVVIDTFKIKQGGTTTDVIEVESEKSPVQFMPDKKIFNVSKNPINSTGTATDVLKTVPSVSVDSDGNVSLRGSGNVRIFIDGKPVFQSVTQLLESIPANMVESIELITNPGAKFDAEGETGIINLILKKNDSFGYNGVLNLSTGTKDKYNAGINLNLKSKKLNIFGNYSFNLFNFGMNGTSLRLNTYGIAAILDQPSTANMRMTGHNAKLGFEYMVTDKQTLTFSSNLNIRNRTRGEKTTNRSTDINNILYENFLTNSSEINKGYGLDFTLNFLSKFKEPKRSLSIEAVYSRSKNNEDEDITNQYSYINYIPVSTQPYLQLTKNTGLNNSGYFSSDYVHPLGKDSKLEAGYKLTLKESDNDYVSQHLDTTTNSYVDDTNLNSHFNYKEFINAGYITYSNKFGELGIQTGLRTEHAYSKGEQILNGVTFKKKYIDFFPSASLSYKIGMSNELQLSYSRRINRPRGNDMDPSVDRADPLNIRQGNPDLNPEYINAFELSYLRFLPGTFLTSTLFFRQTNGLITRYRTLIDSVTTLTTFVNLNKAYSYGIELIANTQPVNWFSLNASASYFKTEIRGENVQAELSNSGESWTAKVISTLKLWGGIDFTLMYNYQGRRPTPVGYIEPVQSLDANIKKDFLSGRLSLSLRATDIFNTQEFNVHLSNTGYVQNFIRKRDSQGLFLSLTYKLGTLYENKQQPPRRKKEENNDNNDVDF